MIRPSTKDELLFIAKNEIVRYKKIIKLLKEIYFIYSTYTDSIQFTEDDKSELNKLGIKLGNLS